MNMTLEYLKDEIGNLQAANQRLEDKLFVARQAQRHAIDRVQQVATARVAGPRWPIGLHWRGLARHFVKADPEYSHIATSRLAMALEREVAEMIGHRTGTLHQPSLASCALEEIAARLIFEVTPA